MSSFNSGTSSNPVFVRILIAFVLGVFCFYKAPATFLPVIESCAALLLSLLVALNIAYKELKLYKYSGGLGLCLYGLVFLFGGWKIMDANEKYKPGFFAFKKASFLKLEVNEEPVINGGVLRLKTRVIETIDTDKNELASGRLNISISLDSSRKFDVTYGDQLIVPARYQEIRESLNPGTFDYKSWLADQNIFHQGFFEQREVAGTGRNSGNPVIKYALEVRALQVRFFKHKLLRKDALAFASALILGYRADMDADLMNVYAKTGTIHALSVSGMHVGLIYLLMSRLLGLFGKRKYDKTIKLAVILLAIWCYTILTGLSPSVLRAAIMLSVFIIGKTMNKTPDNYNILAFTALAMLIGNPMQIWNVGFQLSFLAVLGLISLNPTISGWLYFKNKPMRLIWNASSISISAQLATLPLSIYYFHQLPLYFIPANLLIMLPLSALMYGGILILLFRLSILMPFYESMIDFTNSVLYHLAKLPFSTIPGIWINKTELMVLSAALTMLIISLLRYEKRLLIASLCLTAAFTASRSYQLIHAATQKRIVIYNVKNHYAIAFIDGRHAIVLTDLRESDQAYNRQVLPFLEQNSIVTVQLIDRQKRFQTRSFSSVNKEIRFYNYRINKPELVNLRLGNKAAIITNIE